MRVSFFIPRLIDTSSFVPHKAYNCRRLQLVETYSQRKSRVVNLPYPVRVLLLAAADVNPCTRLRRSARELEHLGGKKLFVIERARNNLKTRPVSLGD